MSLSRAVRPIPLQSSGQSLVMHSVSCESKIDTAACEFEQLAIVHILTFHFNSNIGERNYQQGGGGNILSWSPEHFNRVTFLNVCHSESVEI